MADSYLEFNQDQNMFNCNTATPSFKRILITGSNGFIGRTISPYLEKYSFTLKSFDRAKSECIDDAFEGDLTDLKSLQKAINGVDCIIHLAACSDDADFTSQLVPSNVIGIFNIFEAARIARVKRIIFASSCQSADLVGNKNHISVSYRFPTDHYGLTKLWAEDLAQMYSRCFGLSVLVIRLGWVVRSLAEFEYMRLLPGGKELFLSHNDLRVFFRCSLHSAPTMFDIVYAFSKQEEPELFDMEPSRRLLGYEPIDSYPNGLDFDLGGLNI